jgi:two-component system sensor histidine kinase TctE
MQPQPVQRVDLKALCEDILQQHLDAATARGIDLGLDAEPAQAMGHEWLLRELLSNLVDNAVKYSHEGGAVTIRCGRRAASPSWRWKTTARASRRGAPRILERFYRVQGTVGEGNGLGLAIAEEIARVHHSHCNCNAGAGGRGLKVTLSL